MDCSDFANLVWVWYARSVISYFPFMAGFFDFIDTKAPAQPTTGAATSATTSTATSPAPVITRQEPKGIKAEDLLVVDAEVKASDIPNSMTQATQGEAAKAMNTLKTDIITETPTIVMMPDTSAPAPATVVMPHEISAEPVIIMPSTAPAMSEVVIMPMQSTPVVADPLVVMPASTSSVSEMTIATPVIEAIQSVSPDSTMVTSMTTAGSLDEILMAASAQIDQLKDGKQQKKDATLAMIAEKKNQISSLEMEVTELQKTVKMLDSEIALAEKKQQILAKSTTESL